MKRRAKHCDHLSLRHPEFDATDLLNSYPAFYRFTDVNSDANHSSQDRHREQHKPDAELKASFWLDCLGHLIPLIHRPINRLSNPSTVIHGGFPILFLGNRPASSF